LFVVRSAVYRQTWEHEWHPKAAAETSSEGDAMIRFLSSSGVAGLILSFLSLINISRGQTAQAAVSSPAIAVANGPDDSTDGNAEKTLDPASLLPDLPSLPPAKATLVGGTVDRLDRVQDQLTIHVFGGGKMRILFDTRTQVYRDGALASPASLRQGDRVYIDTILDGSVIFARSIRLKSTAPVGESQGTVIAYHNDRGELWLRDSLSPRSIKVRLTSSTRVVQAEHTVSPSALVPGTLVAVKFDSQPEGRDRAREITVLAVPGTSFTFTGQVTSLDLRNGLLVVTSTVNHRTYEIYLDQNAVAIDENLRPGAYVTVVTRFDGSRYVARNLSIDSPNQQNP
jgi:uncharacterized protein DUF5666